MKSLEFLKPTLATTLAIVLAWLLSVRPAQAGYVVTLQQVGPDVVATGSGAIDLTGLRFSQSTSLNPAIRSGVLFGVCEGACAYIYTGPTSSSVDSYYGASGPTSFGRGGFLPASSGSGDMVGMAAGDYYGVFLSVPTGYVSGTALSDSATYSGTTLAALGVTQGTYVWTWGTGANQNFTLQILPAPPATNITNISARVSVQTGPGVAIGGFIITGTAPKRVILRAIGPSLAGFGISNPLADPVLELHGSDGSLITSNDNWKDTQQAEIEATGIPPQSDLESAIISTLDPGNYTAVVSGKNGGTGVGLVEGYDLDQAADSQFANISNRGFVETGTNVMIGGFILGGVGGNASVVVRALGPSLPQFEVSGALADPTLELHDGNGALIRSNDNWKETQQTDIEATGLQPTNDLEPAIFQTLAPGAYTAIVSGSGDLTGVALVEVYRLP